ncbi:hypothetical protein NUW58_g3839 [Xylaria curta]|uniref:Uncharacterized protein n=1 Tax=Xylaria curta TaxID=42375 RepID=A0ACC1P960_9PEZI|nr:hypothetical protein NUW58_g3839 [Xylaria curta]
MKFLPAVVVALAHLRVAWALPTEAVTEVGAETATEVATEGEGEPEANFLPLPPCPNLVYSTAFCCKKGTLGLYQECSTRKGVWSDTIALNDGFTNYFLSPASPQRHSLQDPVCFGWERSRLLRAAFACGLRP